MPTSPREFSRALDRPAKGGAPGREMDLSPLLGTWLNTYQDSRAIRKIVIRRQDGNLLLRPYGACQPELCDWGPRGADAVYAGRVDSSSAAALTASYDFGFLESQLQINLNLGLMIVAAFTTFKDGSGRSNYFSREFFRLQGSESQEQPASPVGSAGYARREDQTGGGGPPGGDLSISPDLPGTWLNSDAQAQGIVRVDIAPHESSARVRGFGACEPDPCDWGEVAAPLFAADVDSVAGTTFNALYDYGFAECHLQGYAKKGVLVVVNFNRFKDGSGRSNYFYREFFYRRRANP